MTASRLPGGVLAATLLIAFWLGAALLTIAVVAPAAFAVLPTRSLAGALVGRVLPTVFISGVLLGPLVWWLLRQQGVAAASVVMGVGSLCCTAILLFVNPRIASLRVTIGGPVDALLPTDPRRQLFGVLHAVSVVGLGLGVLCAVVAVAILITRLRRHA